MKPYFKVYAHAFANNKMNSTEKAQTELQLQTKVFEDAFGLFEKLCESKEYKYVSIHKLTPQPNGEIITEILDKNYFTQPEKQTL